MLRLRATFHLTIFMRGQREMGKIQRNNYRHGNCRPSLTGKTSSVSFILTYRTHWSAKNRWVRSSLYLVVWLLISEQRRMGFKSHVGSFVEWAAKNSGGDNGDRHRITKVFLINRLILVITLVWETVHTSAIAQIAAKLLKKTLQLPAPW